ncbi:MAG: hypothetical protein CO093_02050 [Alphaproteobacteria bacterium CG_4_9_14_3_um_filter_47_13]|nr:MAG: hypothetical protein CO093_02050 [Alphaproteobacteria bacterium CG_4_9_14_3_um_filter_47_13]
MSKSTLSRQLNFAEINAAALTVLPSLLGRWLPDGKLHGREYTARNPRRADRKAGSFRVNVRTGRWADFATGDKSGDVISLAAYLSGNGQGEAARELAKMLGVNHA